MRRSGAGRIPTADVSDTSDWFNGRVNVKAVNGGFSRAARARSRQPLAAERAVLAFRARADRGLSFSEIAAELGISKGAAFKAYQRELTVVRELVDPDEVHEHVALQVHRLDRALRVAVAITDDPEEPADVRLRAIDRVLRVEERRARLLGLDAPQRAELGVRPLTPIERLTPEQEAEELAAFGMPAALAVARGPEFIEPPPNA